MLRFHAIDITQVEARVGVIETPLFDSPGDEGYGCQ